MIKVLLIEDDEACAYTIKGGLELIFGYEVVVAREGKEGLVMYSEFCPDVVVTDIEMPKMDGYQLVEQIRAIDKSVIIIIESQRTMPKDVLKGFELGIDDYIKKPYVAEELDVRIKKIIELKSSQPKKEKTIPTDYYFIGNYKFDFINRTLQYNDFKQKLTPFDFSILKILYDNKNTVVPRNEILDKIWGGHDEYKSRCLDIFTSKLRKYLIKDSTVELCTVTGVGLKLQF